MSDTTFEPAGSSSTNENNNNENSNTNNEENSMFECNICLEQSTEPVITLCGHLFWYVNSSFLFNRAHYNVNITHNIQIQS
jgi:hypothetical protein